MEQIVIIKADGTQIPLFSRKNVSCVSKAAQKTDLLSEDIVSISLTSAVPLDLGIGDHILLYGKPYKFNQQPEPTKEGERRYTYDLKLEGLQYDLIDAHYHLPEDAYGETYYSDLAGHLQVLMWNINRIYPGKWVLGEYPKETEYKNITNSGKNCLQVAQELCSDYGVEFEITTDGKKYTLNFKAKVGITHAFTLKYGRGLGLYKLQRKNVNNSGIVTRLYVYGGTENLGSNYGHTRLCLPGTTRLTSYIEDENAIKLYGIKEGEKDYDNIKPQRVGTVTALGADVITFADSTMFDLNAKAADGKSTKYLIDGTSAKIKFETGGLAGYEFDLHSYDHVKKTFIINKFQDENGVVFPSDTSAAFQIAVGDKYSISDIQLPDEFIDEAEKDLEEEGRKYLPTVSQPQVSYKLELTEGFFIKLWGKEIETEVLHVGDFIKVEDKEIGVNKAVRITQIERDLLKPHSYDITLSDTVTKTTTVRVWNELKEIDEIIKINKLADPAKARRRWKATQELLNMVFDPEGDYYSEKIKPLSIETNMLSVGAKSMQFVLRNTRFEPNYGGDANTLYVSGGNLIHYAIDDSAVKMWYLENVTFEGLSPGLAYYIYARCPKSRPTGNIILSEEAKTVESEAGFYNFLVGVLNSVVTTGGENPGRLVSLTYGSSTINGRFIRTGRIEGNAGTCYFDLDNDEIGGVIKFVKNDGTVVNATDVDEKANEAKDYINNTLPGILDAFQSQLDGRIEQFFYETDPSPLYENPTMEKKLPNSEWGTVEENEEHYGDLYYNTSSGRVWRFVEREIQSPGRPVETYYCWVELEDTEAAKALQIAQDAMESAGEKRRVFVSTPKPPYDIGDLWVQGSTGDIMFCITARISGNYNAEDWEKACKYTDDSGLTDFINNSFNPKISDLTTQIDGKIESWFQVSDPSYEWIDSYNKEKHLGDFWYKTDENRLYRYEVTEKTTVTGQKVRVYSWEEIKNQDALDAYKAASKAQDTADGKRRVFVATPNPPYDIGDLWLTGGKTDGVLKRCITARTSGSYVANDWAEAVYYDNTQTVIDGGIVTAGTVQLAGDDQSIKAGITGEGTEDTSVRFWAGASYGNRATAPFQVLQSGKIIAANGNVFFKEDGSGFVANKNIEWDKNGNVFIKGRVRTGFETIDMPSYTYLDVPDSPFINLDDLLKPSFEESGGNVGVYEIEVKSNNIILNYKDIMHNPRKILLKGDFEDGIELSIVVNGVYSSQTNPNYYNCKWFGVRVENQVVNTIKGSSGLLVLRYCKYLDKWFCVSVNTIVEY